MTDLSLIDTIVLIMFENRSFDHILGHLSYRQYANGSDVDGLRDPLTQQAYENLYAGDTYNPFPMRDGMLPDDPPHEREVVTTQLAYSKPLKRYTMSGFVEAYYHATPSQRTLKPETMGFLTPDQVPITSFLANNYAVCDRWFAPIPTSTQPNKLMALTGDSRVDHSSGLFPKADQTLLDWCETRGIRWRVYHPGISFFALLGRLDLVFGPNFRSTDHLLQDVMTEPAGTFPQLIVVEPSYGDAPHLGSDHANDNHPPLAVGFGEQYLREVYTALTSNPTRWARTVMILTYDEHGGFFDHVPPINVPYAPPGNEYPPFDNTGIRVPAIVASPLVASRTVCHNPMDHTAILQFLAERFGAPGKGYSPTVNRRRDAGITSVSQVLNLSSPRTSIPAAPNLPILAQAMMGQPPAHPTPMQLAFQNAAASMIARYPTETAERYPALAHWQLETAGTALAVPQPVPQPPAAPASPRRAGPRRGKRPGRG